MAYLEGNSVLIEGNEFNVSISKCNFTKNLGATTTDGAALVLRQTTPGVNPGFIELVDNKFEQNYASQKGSSINILGLSSLQLKMEGQVFSNNTAAYSMFEMENNLPFFRTLAM